uniref:Uncharacterized protein n=1 Tax=Daucus carota subsp. sativus TaxID=79200 RepID=A0A166C720_DAUCS
MHCLSCTLENLPTICRVARIKALIMKAAWSRSYTTPTIPSVPPTTHFGFSYLLVALVTMQ